MVVAPGIPPFPRGPYRPPPPDAAFQQSEYSDPAVPYDPYAHPSYIDAYRRPPSPIAEGRFVPKPYVPPPMDRSRSAASAATATSSRSRSVPPTPVTPVASAHGHRRHGSAAAEAPVKPPTVSSSGSSTPSVPGSSRSSSRGPSSVASHAEPHAPVPVIPEPEPIVVPAPAKAAPAKRGKLIKPRPLKKLKEPTVKPDEPVVEREPPSWVGPRSRPQSFVAPASEHGALDHARVGLAGAGHPPDVLADRPTRGGGSVRTRAESTASSFVVLPLPPPQQAPPALYHPPSSSRSYSPPPGFTLVPPSTVPSHFSTRHDAPVAPSIHSLEASSSQSIPPNSITATPLNMDKIDELDESDPYGMAWHHSSPYEAIKANSQVGSKPGSAVGANRAGVKPSHSLAGSSVHTSPGHRIYAGVGARSAANGSSSTPSPYPAHMAFIPEALPPSQARAYTHTASGSGSSGSQPPSPEHLQRVEEQEAVSPPVAHHRIAPMRRDMGAHTREQRVSPPASDYSQAHRHMPERVSPPDSAYSEAPRFVPPPSHHHRGHLGPPPPPPMHGEEVSPVRDTFDAYDGMEPEDSVEPWSRSASDPSQHPSHNASHYSHAYPDDEDHERKYGGPPRAPLAPRINDAHAYAADPRDPRAYQGYAPAALPTHLHPGQPAYGGRSGPGSVMSGSSGGRSGGYPRGPPPPTHRPRRLVMPSPLQAQAGAPRPGGSGSYPSGSGSGSGGGSYGYQPMPAGRYAPGARERSPPARGGMPPMMVSPAMAAHGPPVSPPQSAVMHGQDGRGGRLVKRREEAPTARYSGGSGERYRMEKEGRRLSKRRE